MITDEILRQVFEKYKTIAVYGMSRFPEKPAQWVPAYLLSKGYSIIPINPFTEGILGRKSYPDLKDIPERIEILEVFRSSYSEFEIVKMALSRKKERGDIDVIWFQEGIENNDSRGLAEEAGITFIQDRCMVSEHKRLFPERDRVGL